MQIASFSATVDRNFFWISNATTTNFANGVAIRTNGLDEIFFLERAFTKALQPPIVRSRSDHAVSSWKHKSMLVSS